ncbi:hypothetical protein [Nonomuraea sp. NPDC050202]|uniref:hypothetical protein n=1 Tax=Nonomuraea sp. NPDC050202 TaxID=3155035 RepID=UPI003400A268
MPTVPVDATAIRRDHLTPHNGQIVKVKGSYKAGPGRIVLIWAATDSSLTIGTIEVAATDTVQCVRVADWLAAVREAASA